MGGHGGLNILPQKRWNVYNYENREKVRKDEEAAAKEEQLKREQSRKRDTEFRLEKLRQARGVSRPSTSTTNSSQSISKSGHVDLFEGLKDFPSLGNSARDQEEEEEKNVVEKEDFKNKKKKMKKEEAPRVVTPEDEKYRLGYGLAGKGVKAPWYLSKSSFGENGEGGEDVNASDSRKRKEGSEKSGKKSLKELREERLKRERREKERERELVLGRANQKMGQFRGSISGFSRRELQAKH